MRRLWLHATDGAGANRAKITERNAALLPQRWAIRFAVEGDLRFLSHHDLMRAVERLVSRAALPVRYSQGFNPRPVFSLPCPRSVGVSCTDDVLAITMDEELPPAQLLERLNAQAPAGLRFLSAQVLDAGIKPVVRRAVYDLPLPAEKIPAVTGAVERLQDAPTWMVQRQTAEARPGQAPPMRTLDIRPLVARLAIVGDHLQITLAPQGDLWARPGEVLRCAGLDELTDICHITRIEVQYD